MQTGVSQVRLLSELRGLLLRILKPPMIAQRTATVGERPVASRRSVFAASLSFGRNPRLLIGVYLRESAVALKEDGHD
jgi:hypothetical protein